MILRPADAYIDRLNKTPWCPKCGKKTTWKARDQNGMCPSCFRLWTASTRTAQLEDVTSFHAAKIRELSHISPNSERVMQTMNKQYPVEGKQWTLPVIVYVVAHREFLPAPQGITKPLYIHKTDRQSISYRCSHMDEDSNRIEHERCRCYWGIAPCVCYCHQGRMVT